MTHHEELGTLTDEELASVQGGFMELLQTAMGLAGKLINKHGDDKAKQGFSTASSIVGQIAPQIGQLLGSATGSAG